MRHRAKTAATAMMLLISLTAVARAQESSQEPTQASPGTDQGQAAPEWYVGKPIKDFTFTGLLTIKPDELKPIVAPYVGRTFSVDTAPLGD